MAYRDIAVFLDPTPESDDRIRLAIELAIRHDARLLGVDVTPRSAYEAGSPEHSRAQSLPDIFHDLTSASACRAEYAVAEPERANWMDFYAHYVDLVVMSKQSPETRHLVPASIPEDVLLSSGVPCLILPSMWTRSAVGTNVVIAWSASREAIRAVHDAMPILQAASKVTLFCADPKSDGEHSDPSLIAGHLLRHGVDAKVDTLGAIDQHVGRHVALRLPRHAGGRSDRCWRLRTFSLR